MKTKVKVMPGMVSQLSGVALVHIAQLIYKHKQGHYESCDCEFCSLWNELKDLGVLTEEIV